MKLLFGDCLEKMKEIPDSSIDLVLTDPPYGITKCKWDVVIPFDLMWKQLKRIIKNNAAIVLFGCQPFSSKLILSNLDMFKYEWIWDKHIPRGFQVAKYRPMNRHENILVFGNQKINYYPQKIPRDKPVTVKNYSRKNKISSNDIGIYNDSSKKFTYYDRNSDTMITGYWEANGKKKHSAQKPVSLMKYLIKTYTKEKETVLDFAAGSFSTGIAAISIDRDFIGIENDKEYFDYGKNRIMEKLLNV